MESLDNILITSMTFFGDAIGAVQGMRDYVAPTIKALASLASIASVFFIVHAGYLYMISSSRGGTLYDRRARSSKTPTGVETTDNTTSDRSGTFYDRNRDIDLHVTQYYDDKTHVSWDIDGKTDRGHHWTNQSKHKGDRVVTHHHLTPASRKE